MTASKGLEGVVATESSISSIIDDKLTYSGYSIDDLADNLWTISLNEVYDEIDLKYSVFELADVIREHGATDIRDMRDFEVYEVYRKLHPNTFIYLADDKFICVD